MNKRNLPAFAIFFIAVTMILCGCGAKSPGLENNLYGTSVSGGSVNQTLGESLSDRNEKNYISPDQEYTIADSKNFRAVTGSALSAMGSSEVDSSVPESSISGSPRAFFQTAIATSVPDIDTSQYGKYIRINEYMQGSAFVLRKEDGTAPDWVEIVNSGNTTENLSGFGLTDKFSKPFKYTFPDFNA